MGPWRPGRSAHGTHCPLWAGSQGRGPNEKLWWTHWGTTQICLEHLRNDIVILIWNFGYIAYFKYKTISVYSLRQPIDRLQENNDILVRAGLGSQPSNGDSTVDVCLAAAINPCWLMIFGSYTSQYVWNITLPSVISNIYYLIELLIISQVLCTFQPCFAAFPNFPDLVGPNLKRYLSTPIQTAGFRFQTHKPLGFEVSARPARSGSSNHCKRTWLW